jgi:SAM-dependent methyltransferase
MLGLAEFRRQERGQEVVLVRGIAERLPFADDSFDCVICQGSLDHFAQPDQFMAEVARILKPGGRLVIALANFDSLSCRLGRLVHRFRRRFRMAEMPARHYWQPPQNHTFKGNAAVLRRLATPWLRLEPMHGVSLLWLVRRWSLFVDSLPEPVAWALLRTADRLAYHVPSLSDTLIAVGRPRKEPPQEEPAP